MTRPGVTSRLEATSVQGTGSGARAENVCSDGSYARSGMYSCSTAPAPSWLAERRRKPSLPARRTCTHFSI